MLAALILWLLLLARTASLRVLSVIARRILVSGSASLVREIRGAGAGRCELFRAESALGELAGEAASSWRISWASSASGVLTLTCTSPARSTRRTSTFWSPAEEICSESSRIGRPAEG